MLQGQQNLTSDTLKMALYTGFVTLGPTTTAYSSEYETSGTGYTVGGNTLANVSIASSANGIVYVSFSNPSWANASFTARGALIYNATQSNSSVAVLDFGADKTCSNQTFTVTLPANTATTALIRFP
jgi:hypothetical protein